jgi:aspartyl-tRNA(Asn)/glutamyl-tRNA(Gln) amidotransferase subunit B
MNEYEPVIGLEVHAELQTRSKMFCGCAIVDSTVAEPNTSVCEICTAMPGTLPVVNRRAVEYAIRVALALECTIEGTSRFARKNYFYPDLPKGYQISQYDLPLARAGRLMIDIDGAHKPIRIRRVHLEEDTGKLSHEDGYSLVDFNRAGVPLLEIVSEPDMRSVNEAAAYASALRQLLRYLEVNSGDMEKGVLRFEANVSLRAADSQEFGTRVEIKNLNSFRAMTRSIEHELARQAEVLSAGGRVVPQTLGWDEAAGTTVPQRSKEEAEDYRYFPEPDLPPLVVKPTWVDEIRETLPELPLARSRRFTEQYGLSGYAASVLTGDRPTADYFEAAVSAAARSNAGAIANWLTGELFALLNEAEVDLVSSPLAAAALAELVDLVESGQINATTGKQVLAASFHTGSSPTDIVEERGLQQESDPDVLHQMIEQILDDHPDQVHQYLDGKSTINQWFFGQVMKRTRGQADPQVVRRLLDEALASLRGDAELG